MKTQPQIERTSMKKPLTNQSRREIGDRKLETGDQNLEIRDWKLENGVWKINAKSMWICRIFFI